MNINLLLPFIVSFLLTILFVPPTIKFAKKFKLVDDPKKHNHPALLHKKTVPRAGGLPIFLAFFIAVSAESPVSL